MNIVIDRQVARLNRIEMVMDRILDALRQLPPGSMMSSCFSGGESSCACCKLGTFAVCVMASLRSQNATVAKSALENVCSSKDARQIFCLFSYT